MGFKGVFKRRRERESAIPPGTLETGDVQTAPAEAAEPPTPAPEPPTPAPEPPPLPPPPGDRSIADEVTAAAGGDLATHVERLRALMAEHKVDLESQPMDVRKKIVRDLNRSGVPAKLDEPLQVTDIGQVQAIEAVLKKHGLLPENEDAAAA
jgi:hypothetical protein